MHTEHADFHPPRDPNATIWRYVDLPRYLSLLTTRSLFLSRVDLLGDEIEGTISLPTVQGDYLDPRRPTSLQGLQEALRRYRETLRRNVAISCWHIADSESAGMWDQYAESGKGVAIKSTYTRLIKSIEGWPQVFFAGCVSYADYEHDVISGTTMLAPFIHKPREYRHEQEMRIVVSQLPAGPRPDGQLQLDHSVTMPSGILAPVNLEILIEEIVFAPKSPEWQMEAIEATTRALGFTFPLQPSSLTRKGFYG